MSGPGWRGNRALHGSQVSCSDPGMSRDLPHPIESELIRLLDGREEEFSPGVASLCEKHPQWAPEIRAEAARLQRAACRHAPEQDAPATQASERDAGVRIGEQVGPFIIRERIGHGGMGTVYVAEQREPVQRHVALKVIKLGMDTGDVLARFEAERQALALMDHSNIAKVFEAGSTAQGRPYFAMEYVKGKPITTYCDEHRLSLDERLLLFKQVCSGVQHAHTKGVIHRDLTPNNVLVSLQDGKPTAKIIDFGLARATDRRLTERTIFTERGAILGTPEYMSPEQAGLDRLDVDMRSDVYTLGVLLYELVTGRLPFETTDLRAAGYDVMCRTIREVDPPRPSTRVATHAGGSEAVASLRRTDTGSLLHRLRGDLDWIAMKCLEKDRTRRYETASELAADVQRHLEGEPVLARAPTFRYRLGKFARRHRAQIVASALIMATLIAGLIGTTTFWLEARTAANTARGAQANERARAEEAQRATGLLAATVADFNMLAGVVHLKRALARAPLDLAAEPENLARFDQWLSEEATPLMRLRPELETAVAKMRDGALPRTGEHVAQDLARHPRYHELESLRAKLDALVRADSIRRGAPLEIPTPTELDRHWPPLLLNELAWAMVEPEDTRLWGSEARGLAVALLAWDGSERQTPVERAAISDTLAWAWFANGQDAKALAQAELSVAAAPEERVQYDHQLEILRAAIERAKSPEGRTELEQLRASEARLSAELSTARSYRFADPSRQFLHDALVSLAADIEAMEDDEVRTLQSRRAWAGQVDSLTRAAWSGGRGWEQARIAIAAADGVTASEAYRADKIDLVPQLGLVPIGMNPVSRLWEFLDLRSAWEGRTPMRTGDLTLPGHAADGSLPVHPANGIVFVLIPGDWSRSVLPFFLSRYELTNDQWSRLQSPSQRRAGQPAAATEPAVNISEVDAVRTLKPWGMHLPRLEDWRHAIACGADLPTSYSTTDLITLGNTYLREDGYSRVAPIGSFPPNAWGLHDMLGNVSEWTMTTFRALGNTTFAGDPDAAGPGLFSSAGLSWKQQYEAKRKTFPEDGRHNGDRMASDLGVRPWRALRY